MWVTKIYDIYFLLIITYLHTGDILILKFIQMESFFSVYVSLYWLLEAVVLTIYIFV